MKRNLIIGFLLLLIGILGFQKYTAPKTYTVTLTLDEWQKVMRHIELGKSLIIKSDLPARDAAAGIDSLSQSQQLFSMQIMAQLQAESKDTLKTKK